MQPETVLLSFSSVFTMCVTCYEQFSCYCKSGILFVCDLTMQSYFCGMKRRCKLGPTPRLILVSVSVSLFFVFTFMFIVVPSWFPYSCFRGKAVSIDGCCMFSNAFFSP